MINQPMRPAFLNDQNLHLLLFGGKGGVGKTTSALATALYLAKTFPEKKYLIASSDPAHSLMDGLGEQASMIPSNLTIIELNAQECLTKFKALHAEHLREIAKRGTFLDDSDINQFLELSLPGLDELMAFLEISEWVSAENYDCVIVDTAPTGHTLRLLGMPELLHRWLGMLDALLAKNRYMKKLFSGNYYGDELDQFLLTITSSVKNLEALLCDVQLCRFVPVMLAEALSINETKDLLTALQRLQIPVSEIVVNQLFPHNDCATCREAYARQNSEIRAMLQSYEEYNFWRSELQPEEMRGVNSLEHFWDDVEPLTLMPEVVSVKASVNDFPTFSNVPVPKANLLFFAGKGGVGKTTLACATAMRLAQTEGKKVLLCSTDPAHSLADCFALPIGAEIVAVTPNLSVLEINANAEFEVLQKEYAHDLKKFLSAAMQNLDFTFDREVMERMIDLAPPGLDEVMALLRVIELHQSGKYDVVVLDTAPTGHLIRLLEMPTLIDQWLKAFFGVFLKYRNMLRLPRLSQLLVEMSKNLKKLRTLLADGTKARISVVSIPTEVAYAETRDLLASCEQMKITVGGIFINLTTPQQDCTLCHALAAREAIVKTKFQVSFPRIPQAVIPRQGELRGLSKLGELGKALYQYEMVRTAGR